MQLLKQSTQVKVVLGPFKDATDDLTPETGVTLGAADDASLIKHDSGSVVDLAAATFAAITGADGYYNLTLTEAHTDTLGMLTALVTDTSVCRPVYKEFMVVTANVYDTLCSTDQLDVNVTNFNGNAASGLLSGTTALNADVTKIDGTDSTDFVSDTDKLRTDVILFNGNAASGLLTDTDKLRADIVEVNGDSSSAANLAAGANGITRGTVASGSSTTIVKTNLSETTSDHYNGRTIIFISGALAGQGSSVTDYSGASRDLTVVALTEAPGAGDLFILV